LFLLAVKFIIEDGLKYSIDKNIFLKHVLK